MINIKRYTLYLVRWQLSTPILAVCLVYLATIDKWIATIIANLIGGLIFFWVDRFIFTSRALNIEWEVEEECVCVDCNKHGRGYRIVKGKNYDRVDAKPEFRCEECSQKKAFELKENGRI